MSIKYSEFLKLGPRLVKRGDVHNSFNSRYECPGCVDEKHRKKARFYYSEKKRRGQCFICGLKVYDDQKLELNELCQLMLGTDQPQEQGLTYWDLSRWTYPITQAGAPLFYDYVTRKRGLSPAAVEKYGLRYCNIPYRGVVMPNSRDASRTDFFQVRSVDDSSRLRYTNCSTLKPVYTAGLDIKPEAVISEGCISAISTDSDSYSSLALYGKSISDFQLRQLDESALELPTLCLDGGELLATINAVERLLKIRERVNVICLPWGKDSNDVLEHFPKFYADRRVVDADGPAAAGWATKYKHLKYNETCGEKEWNDFRQSLRRLGR